MQGEALEETEKGAGNRLDLVMPIDDTDSDESSGSSFDSDGDGSVLELDDLDCWRADDGLRSSQTVRWNCQSCRCKLPEGPRAWLSAESRSPFGALCGWVQGTNRTWEVVSERPGWLRYFFCRTLCLRAFAVQSREADQESE